MSRIIQISIVQFLLRSKAIPKTVLTPSFFYVSYHGVAYNLQLAVTKNGVMSTVAFLPVFSRQILLIHLANLHVYGYFFGHLNSHCVSKIPVVIVILVFHTIVIACTG